MASLRAQAERFFRAESGASLLEYALLLGLLAMACFAAMLSLSGSISDMFNRMNGKLSSLPN